MTKQLPDNVILETDSYKLTHDPMYPDDCEVVGSYLESRHGATHPYVLWNGLQPILHFLQGRVVTDAVIDEAAILSEAHFGDASAFNRKGWEHIRDEFGGRLPVRIKAAPEGTIVPTGNCLMYAENTSGLPSRFLTNALESVLLHSWYPTTVATISHDLKQFFLECKKQCSEDDFVDFMLHDFGYRGASTKESAGVGGCGHLISFKGTDTLRAMRQALWYYDADLASLAFSVPATEHSVMTAEGELGEFKLIERLIRLFNKGIFSMVGDSFNIMKVANEYIPKLKDLILAREPNAIGACKFVLRPDSLRGPDDTPEEQMLVLTQSLADTFGYENNKKNYKVLNPKVGVLWGDGINPDGIKRICKYIMARGWSVDHLVFGMGGGLLQKVNRDTERFATKCCAMRRSGEWVKVQKNPLDVTKASKGGRMKLIRQLNLEGKAKLVTMTEDHPLYHDHEDVMVPVFENGEILREFSFEEVRQNACKSYKDWTDR